MANNTPGYCLFKDSQGFDITRLPNPYRSWNKTSTDQTVMSIHNRSKTRATLHRYTTQALLDYADVNGCEIGVVKMAYGSYASQWMQPDGSSIIAHATANGVLSAGRRDALTCHMTALPGLGASTTEFNDASILMIYMMIEADINEAAGNQQNTITWDLLQRARDEFATNGVIPEDIVRLVCDDLYHALSYGAIPVNIRNGNVSLLTERRMASNEFATGSIVCGNPDILTGGSSGTSGSNSANGRQTVKDAKALAASYTANLHWTAEEEMLIPQFDDDVEVPPEVMTILNRFLKSLDWASPMNNPCWRGITAYGKSTGVKILACILHTPLLWMTCATTTEVEDFLSKHVPNTDPDIVAMGSRPMPTFDDMANDPEYAFQMITGEERENATSEDCLKAYAEAVAADKSGISKPKNPFKIVESDFVRALVKGYIVEVQEFSRIRDSGTLVGLNNFNEPGSVIPLVDGRHVRRHPNALCVWTDNIGYTSCRKVDGSVLRRFSFIIDSYEMPRDRALRRIQKNTGCKDNNLIDRMYDVWDAIGKFCKTRDITDEGTCSLTELENWVSLTMLDGIEAIVDTCREAIISKLSSDPDTQKEIMDSCVALEMSKAGFSV